MYVKEQKLDNTCKSNICAANMVIMKMDIGPSSCYYWDYKQTAEKGLGKGEGRGGEGEGRGRGGKVEGREGGGKGEGEG